MLEVTIDENYLTNVVIRKQWSTFQDKETLTADEAIKVLKGEDLCTMTHSADHPEFSKLRIELSNTGYIYLEDKWINGDRVLKPFSLNGFLFEIGQKFPCAAAMGISLKVARQYNRNTLL
jgi:hypothetical protein